MPSLRRKPKAQARLVVEKAMCTETFRPGAIAALVTRGDVLPIGHPTVKTHPGFFVGLVPLEEVNDADQDL